MNIITYNVRGLERAVKWAAIRRLVKKEKLDMICIQETKKESIERSMCQAMWGDTTVSWEVQQAINSAGGLLCMWTENTFTLQRKVMGNGFICLTGLWINEALQVHIVNIYSPCDTQSKRILWENIKQLKTANQGELWCIMGDFNIRDPVKRMGVCQRGMEEKVSGNLMNGLMIWRWWKCHGLEENLHDLDPMALQEASWIDF